MKACAPSSSAVCVAAVQGLQHTALNSADRGAPCRPLSGIVDTSTGCKGWLAAHTCDQHVTRNPEGKRGGLLGAALANLANWVRESPEPDLPGRTKSTGGKPLKDREFRAKLQEEAKGPHTTNGALHWRMRRPHVPSTLPDRTGTGNPAPPTSVPTGRLGRRYTAPDGPEFTGHIVSGPPAESVDNKFGIRRDVEEYGSAGQANASIKLQQKCGYKIASKTVLEDGSVHVQWQDSVEIRDSG